MSQEQAKQFIEQATQSIQGGQFAQALELIEQAIALVPDDSESHVLRGIALSQTGRPQEATEAFRKAISLSPYNAKAYFNLAVHLYASGDKVEALEMAREAAKIDVSHSGARELIARIEGESATPEAEGMARSEEMPPPGSIPPAGTAPMGTPVYQSGYESSSAHSIAFVEGLGSKWTTIAWVLVAIAVVVFGVGLSYSLPLLSQLGDMSNLQKLAQEMQQNQPPAMMALSVVGWINRIALLVWMIMDILDRRGQWLWIAPIAVCCCCGLEWVGVVIYMLAGRK